MFFQDAAGSDHSPQGRGLGIEKIDERDRAEDGVSLDDLRMQVREAVSARGGR